MVAHAKMLDSSEQLAAITHPTRLRVLDALRSPDSAAGVARTLGEPRQRINHHVKELEKAGLIVAAGERRNGNFVEQLFESVAGTFIVSPRLTWGDGERVQAMADQLSLQHLVEFGERLQRDAAALLDRAAFDAEDDPQRRGRSDRALRRRRGASRVPRRVPRAHHVLIERYATATGPGFTVGLVVHPTTEDSR